MSMSSDLRVLLRKNLKVPRQGVLRLEVLGIRTFDELLKIRVKDVPKIWHCLKTRGRPHVFHLQAFCYWYRCNRYVREAAIPGIYSEEVEDALLDWVAKWLKKRLAKEKKKQQGHARSGMPSGVQGSDTVPHGQFIASRRGEGLNQGGAAVNFLEPMVMDGFASDRTYRNDSGGSQTSKEDAS